MSNRADHIKPKSGGAMNPARRRFLTDTARLACGVGASGLLLGMVAEKSEARHVDYLRPPGALDDDRFLAACVRCGLCVRDCPYDILHLAGLLEPVATGTPYFVAREKPCEMCEDIPCVVACPSGALDKELTNIDDARMGVAVLVGTDTCLNYLGLRCDVCYRVCPLIDEAITLDRQHNKRTGAHARFIPTVDSDHCTGCGKCERACVLEKTAIKILPRDIALGELGHHYRLGWEEKEAAGGSLIPEQIDLPDRRPEPKGGQ